MKVVHIESGLGNQMLSFAEYLVIKKLNPFDRCYLETIIYEIPEANAVINQWFGFELNRIFGINEPNIKELYSNEEWRTIISEIKKSDFWNDGWRYANVITTVLNNHGLHLNNYLGNEINYSTNKTLKNIIFDTRFGYDLKRWLRPLYEKKYIEKFDASDKVFIKTDEDVYTGQTLCLRNTGVNIDFIAKEIREAFTFPEFNDEKNIETCNLMKECNSVAIHARRGDMLQSNGYCYKYGYFKRATKYVKKHVKNPVFFFFCDTGSISWCKDNLQIFGLISKDDYRFVDWNKGENYYRDMQLMSCCKHNIITNSSFGWWGAYFNNNPNKITCSPNVWINTTNHF